MTLRKPCPRRGGWSSWSKNARNSARTRFFRSIASGARADRSGRKSLRAGNAWHEPPRSNRAGRDVPEIFDPVRFDTLIERFAGYDAVLFAWELAPKTPLRERIAALPAAGRALVVVGPEGGFTHDEADAAAHRGATLLSLGQRILRTDTAAVALLAVIGALTS